MKVLCTTEHLKNAVLATERFTGRHVTLPILSHILFLVGERKISLIATNLEVGIEYSLPGKIQKQGLATMPAKSFSQILQVLEGETATIETKQNQVAIHTPTSDITLNGLNPADFPTLPEIKKENSFTIAAVELIRAMEQVLPAAATTDLKPELAGILIKTDQKGVLMAATDSFRLSEKTIFKQDAVAADMECIVPARSIQEVLRTLSPAPEDTEVKVHTGEHQMVFEWEGIRVISRLIAGGYPPYKGLIPKTFESSVVVNRADLLRKVRLASVFSSRLNDVTLRMSANQLEVTTLNSEAGGTTARIAAKSRGSAGEVMFNYRYLLDGIEACSGENILINLNGVSGPALIQNPDDSSFLYLVMPIRSA